MSTPPGLMRSTSMQRPTPRVRASVPLPNVGLLTKGNRYHEDTAPQVRFDLPAVSACKPIGLPQAEKAQRWGRMCLGCGEYLPPSAQKCVDCWDAHLAAHGAR